MKSYQKDKRKKRQTSIYQIEENRELYFEWKLKETMKTKYKKKYK